MNRFEALDRRDRLRRYRMKPATRHFVYTRLLPGILIAGLAVNGMIQTFPEAKDELAWLGFAAAAPVAIVIAAIVFGRRPR